MESGQRLRYLEAMGIESWLPRGPAAADGHQAAPAAEPAIQPLQPAPALAEVRRKLAASPAKEEVAVAPSQRAQQSTAVVDQEMPAWLSETPPPIDEYSPTLDYLEYSEDARADDSEKAVIARLDWHGLETRVAECQACGLHESRVNTVFGVGDHNADLMIIGEAPGAEEDRQGEPFVGRAGQLLNAMLHAIQLDRKQVFIANILKCRPPDNRDPRVDEALKCEPYLQRQVALVKPKVILAVGRVAAQNLLKSDEAVGRMRGREQHFNGIPVVVSYHPAYLLRSPQEKAKSWQDLQRAVRLLGA